MSRQRLRDGLAPVHLLAVIALLEVVINRVAVPLLRPAKGAPPTWHTVLDYAGLFLFYFTGTLAAILVLVRVVEALRARRGLREMIAHALLGLAAVLAAIPLLIDTPAELSFALELAFAGAVIALVVAGVGRGRDLGVQVGLAVLAVPLLVHTVNVVGAKLIWPESAFDRPGDALVKLGVLTLCLGALVSPYVFAPRPFSRAVTRPGPVVFAMSIAAVGAVCARIAYPTLARAATKAIGVELSAGQADPRLALYLLAISTLAWTLASCFTAPSALRRQIGLGIAFVLLGGYAFRWPHHYLLPLLGLALVVEAARTVREEELAALPYVTDTPPIADAAWSAYIATVKAGLERTLDKVHTLTTRGEGGIALSMLVGEKAGMTIRARIERIDGSVTALDIVCGREIDEVRGATVTMWAIPPRGLGVNPAGPPAAPAFKTADASFDERFRCRGSEAALGKLLDDGLRARAVATLDGWLAYWEPDGLRYRVYPGRGAPLDHPVPLSDLALGRSASADRLIAVIDLIVEIAARGVTADPSAEPSELSHPEEEAS